MRKSTVRNGMRLLLAAMVMILLASFYHVQISDLFSLSMASESRLYRLGMFWAAAIGGYGVILIAFGFVMSSQKSDANVRIMPLFISISILVFMFFFMLSSSMEAPNRIEQRRLRSGETITI